MPGQDEIADQQNLLTTYRRTLARALSQPSPDSAAIHETRGQIQRIKAMLRSWGVPVEDRAGDEASAVAPAAPARRARIFISYKRDVEPDVGVAMQVFKALQHYHDVFIDRTMLVGTLWAQQIETELRRADYLISFLSTHSVHSEMVTEEITTAYHLAKLQGGRPAILPVRVAYRQPFQYPLSVYLDPINWAAWDDPQDMPRLIDELLQAIAGGMLPLDQHAKLDLVQPQPPTLPAPTPAAQVIVSRSPDMLEMPEGTMDPQSALYIDRSSDAIALETIARTGVTITIKGPRQMGKSSLLIRTVDAATRAGKRAALLDFQLFDRSALSNADLFFRQFCAWLSDELDLPDRVEEYWSAPLGNSQRCTRYMGRYVLKELKGPLTLAMDEVESIFDTSFRSDFFGMLRSWHNSRATAPVWRQLDLALVTSTEPYQLIENLNQSPFNVGQVIELADFTPDQVRELNRRHAWPLNPDDERRLTELLGGHPYLIRRAFYLVASGRMSFAKLLADADSDRGPFGDHLRYHLFRLHDKKDLVQAMIQVLRQHTCEDERIFFRLRGAGLVRRDGAATVPRCQLYAAYFREHLHA
jgi:hypothetical protein